MIKKVFDNKGKFKESYVTTNKNQCFVCKTKGIIEYIDVLEKALYRACAKLETFDCLYGEDLKQASEWEEELFEEAIKEIKKEMKEHDK